MKKELLSPDIQYILQSGAVLPAHPLALDSQLNFDEVRHRALTRYYLASGAGGIAIGVHTTQFEIRDPEINLYETILRVTADEIRLANQGRPLIKVAGVCGRTQQAVDEAEMAVFYGYDLGLVSMAALRDFSEHKVIEHIKTIAEIIPVFGFYLQTAIGGRRFSFEFWREFAEIPNVQAIKVASFNRYQTLDVVRAVCASTRRDQVALYTGNDDNIVADLLTPYHFNVNGEWVTKRFVGGLLGHWAVWTSSAVELFEKIQKCVKNNYVGVDDLLAISTMVTDMNAAIFDPSHSFHGCIAGIHEVLRRQGFLEGTWCLNPKEGLSQGQSQEIDRVVAAYGSLTDDAFANRIAKQIDK